MQIGHRVPIILNFRNAHTGSAYQNKFVNLVMGFIEHTRIVLRNALTSISRSTAAKSLKWTARTPVNWICGLTEQISGADLIDLLIECVCVWG